MELPAADRFSAQSTDDPQWNENSWFSVTIPERRIHGLIQHFFRPNLGLLVGGPVLWDQSGTYQWNCLHYNWSHLQAIPAGAGKYDVTARNSLAVRIVEPLARYKIDYAAAGLELDLVWEALSPYHQMHAADPAQPPSGAFYLEQPGRMTGTIRLGGEALAVDCWSMRDCSAGPYPAESKASGGYFWGMAEGASFLGLCIGKKRELDTIGGHIMRDGVMAALTSGKRTVLDYGRFGPSRIAFEGIDELGRTVQATGTVDPGLVFTGYTDHSVIWSLVEWECDGRTFWGDNQEFYPAAVIRRLARGETTLG